MLPQEVRELLQKHISKVKILHEIDLRNGYGSVELPYALRRKYPNLDKSFHWQYILLSKNLSKDPRSGIIRRHHLYPDIMQKTLKKTMAKLNIQKHATCHTGDPPRACKDTKKNRKSDLKTSEWFESSPRDLYNHFLRK